MSLVDKYTMRSKAYKSMLKNFVCQSISHSQKQYDKLVSYAKIEKFVHDQVKTKKQPVMN